MSDGLFDAAAENDQAARARDRRRSRTVTPIALGSGDGGEAPTTAGRWRWCSSRTSWSRACGGDALSRSVRQPEDGRRLLAGDDDTRWTTSASWCRTATPTRTTLTWNQALDMVLNGEAAMTIMGDWGKGYANAAEIYDEQTFGVIPMPGTAGTFVFTTDTFGLPISARPVDDTMKLLKLFGSQPGQDIFNPIKGSISARTRLRHRQPDGYDDDGEADLRATSRHRDATRSCPRRRSWRRRSTSTRSARRWPSSRRRTTPTESRAWCSTRWTTIRTSFVPAAGRPAGRSWSRRRRRPTAWPRVDPRSTSCGLVVHWSTRGA